MIEKKNNSKGFLLVQTIVFGSVAVIIIGALISWAGVNIKAGRVSFIREQALQIAEAGIDYYRWHLAHASTDYQDGTSLPGPYVHNFYDKDGVLIGSFTLTITPPLTGSTLVNIQSDGRVVSDNSVRKIKVTLGIPSLAKYAVASNDNIRFGQGTEVFGPIHSNGGIRFDGLAHNLMTSSRLDYDDPDHNGANEFGVHTHVNVPPGVGVNNNFRLNEAPPTNPVPTRNDIFVAGRLFPMPSIDFTGMTNDLSQIKANAQAAGRYIAGSGAQGYRLVLKVDDTFDVYRVNNLKAPPINCLNGQNQSGWGTWSIRTSGAGNQTFIANYPIPANGLVFVEDHIWVEGQINTARVTIASGRFPDNVNTRTSITINNNLLYTNYNGTDVISLVAQNNINAGLDSLDTLRIDAALVAQNGRAGRYYYSPNCGVGYDRNTLTLYGMIASNLRYGFAYTDGTGYNIRNIIYDANLLYGPPPSFPLTSDQYSIISWQEVK